MLCEYISDTNIMKVKFFFLAGIDEQPENNAHYKC